MFHYCCDISVSMSNVQSIKSMLIDSYYRVMLCYAERGYATVGLCMSSVRRCPFIRKSTVQVPWSHISWNRPTSKIISQPNGTGSHWPQHGRSGATGTLRKLGWNRHGVMSTKTCNISETMQDRTRVTIWRIRAFDWYTNQCPWMTLNGWNALFWKNRFMEPARKIWMKIEPNCRWQNAGQWFWFL